MFGEMYVVKWGMFGREIHGNLGMTGALIDFDAYV